jgi:hypothetical protein
MSEKPVDPVVLTTTDNESEAAMIVAALDRAGIEAQAVGGLTSGMRAESPGQVQVLVHKNDLDKGIELLKSIEHHHDD